MTISIDCPGGRFHDLDALANELVKAMGLRSRRLAEVMFRVREAVQAAGPRAVARVLADEVKVPVLLAARLVRVLMEMPINAAPRQRLAAGAVDTVQHATPRET